MAAGNQKRTRSERVAVVELPPGPLDKLIANLRRGDVVVRLVMCAVVSLGLWLMTSGWTPPFVWQKGQIPARDIAAQVEFIQVDENTTNEAREKASKLALAVFNQDDSQLKQLRAKLVNEVTQVIAAKKFAEVDPALWNNFMPPLAEGTPQPTSKELAKKFEEFKETLSAEGAIDTFRKEIEKVFESLGQNGILDALPPEHDANFEKIAVQPVGIKEFPSQIAVSEVLLENVVARLQESLLKSLATPELGQHIFAWVKPQLPISLSLDENETRKAQEKAVADVKDLTKTYPTGEILAKGGEPIDEKSYELLFLEYQQILSERTMGQKVWRSLALFGMYLAIYTLCGFYILQRSPHIIRSLSRFTILLLSVVLTVGLLLVTTIADWQFAHAEVIPLLFFGMTMAIVYEQEIALLLSASVTLISVAALGVGLTEAVSLLATTAAAIILLDEVRVRSKLMIVGILAAIVAFFTTIGVGVLDGHSLSYLMIGAAKYALWSVITGSLITCLLPVIEKIYNIQTDLSLLELGDPAHPLLQELVRRAPGTYNHSITVASLAESAAESIGARGLLIRVGAYFHDIGKMLKPVYFIENQNDGLNRHDTLVPTMSTLVIIAHVKDGADLARQNKLPEVIIDFIQQHHGTTLVEYFYRQERDQQKEEDPNAAEVDENRFRYPGPKPQTKEAGILMLADAVESASRVLVEPAPARIESLVEDIARKRLLDGQFDECGLTLKEVRKICDSLVKSLTAVYHGRVKYPDQEVN